MADIYVRSTDGSDSDDGSTWALAKALLSGAAAIDGAGDTIYVSQAHSESSASAQTIALAGTAASPVRVICGNDGAEPPTAAATTAVVATTGANAIAITGIGYVYGITFKAGDGANAANITTANSAGHTQFFESCTFELGGTSTSSSMTIGGSSGTNAKHNYKNCTFKFGATTQELRFTGSGSILNVNGGGFAAGGGGSAFLVAVNATYPGRAIFSGFDASAAPVGLVLVNTAINGCGGSVILRDCKLPASWSGTLVDGTVAAGSRFEMYNCAAGATNYALWIEDHAGTIKHETTLIRTGGASDGTTGLSWQMVGNTTCNSLSGRLYSPEITRWQETTGSAITVTAEILHDSATALTDGEVWLEVLYLGTSGFPLGSVISDQCADPLATAASQTSSSETWTTTGMTNPNTRALSVTFTPQEKGFIIARVVLGKVSQTVYVCPKLTVA